MAEREERGRRVPAWWIVGAAVIAAVVTLGLAALLTNIFERQQEARNPFYRVVELNDSIVDPAIWGQNFPQQYDSYRRTVDMTRTRYGGSEAMVQHPTTSDPRDTVSTSRLVEDPRLREFWAGYAFATDFREERGHAYMFIDQVFTERQNVVQQPGTCLHCHASVYTVYRDAGNGDLIAGFEAVNQMPYQEAAALAEHPVACIDCHDPATMELRVTRPGFMEGIRTFMASRGRDDFDVNTDATRQEMRTFVCAQCHVEYYFQGDEKRLTYPWANGLRADEILAYYEEVGFTDWTHAISEARVLKAQHPEFEMYMQGVHARSGVMCADCHMPYERTGAMKVSDHWVRSPLLNINNACQTCHRWTEEELSARVHTIQDRTYQMRNVAIDAVLDLAKSIRAEAANNLDAQRLTAARTYHKRAQFLTDFIEAENSMGFHADQEAVRVLGLAINYARLGSLALYGDEIPSGELPLLDAPPQTVAPATGQAGDAIRFRTELDMARPGERAGTAVEPVQNGAQRPTNRNR
ncbi:MAG TPA: ammonia-forming cytochrome c nitrite reductase subunit c552 [Longimicrobiales bacterium]|nr:ammonia-forming cytochrome c nitrite reductase subunit c552 [Longimicrobiales bacterium]